MHELSPMDAKFPFLVNLRRIDSLDTFFSDFRKLVAPGETRYCANTVFS